RGDFLRIAKYEEPIAVSGAGLAIGDAQSHRRITPMFPLIRLAVPLNDDFRMFIIKLPIFRDKYFEGVPIIMLKLSEMSFLEIGLGQILRFKLGAKRCFVCAI